MTQDLNSEIEQELTTFSGQTFNSPEEVHKWLRGAFTRIAEKTVEAVRVEERDLDELSTNPFPREGVVSFKFSVPEVKFFNQAVAEQNKRASAWLGRDN